MTAREEAIIAAYADGRAEAEIADIYGATPDEIRRLVATRLAEPVSKPRGPGLNSTGNRIALGVAVGFVAQICLGAAGDFATRMTVWVVVAGITYGLATALRR